jgi:hypothetical protein
MKITNKFNLPKAFENYAHHDKYSRGDADFSVTQLIDAPQVHALREKHWEEMERDVSDQIWALMGTTIHRVLEGGAHFDHITEERLNMEIGESKVSGAIDVQEPNQDGENTWTITDYKSTSSWSVIFGKPEWELQINCYAHLVEANKDVRVTRGRVCVVVRDWMKKKAQTVKDYPQAPIIFVEVPIWGYAKRQAYLEDRVRRHMIARNCVQKGLRPEPCTPQERWQNPDGFAIVKLGNKRATRVFDKSADAVEYLEEINSKSQHSYNIEVREHTPTRCEDDYCGVARWCKQWNP